MPDSPPAYDVAVSRLGTVPDDTSLNTVFTLLWETPTSGSISATGALDYGYSEGVKFSFAPGAE